MTSTTATRKAVHIIGQLHPDGLERRTLELIEASRDSGVEHIICVTSGLQGFLDGEYRKAGATIEYLNIKSLRFPIAFIRMLRERAVDVVHSNLAYTSGYVVFLAQLAGVPGRIVQFRSDGEGRGKTFIRRAQTQVLRLLINWSATTIAGLTPQNLDIAWGEGWRNDARCRVITNGVAVFDELPDPSFELNGYPETSIVIHAGRADIPTKNREKALSVFACLLKSRPDSVLVFVGRDGSDDAHGNENRTRWQAWCEEHGILDRVLFLGQKDSIIPYMAGADVMLFTSTLEGLPGVVLEALSVGLPVVASDLPGCEFIAESADGIVTINPSAADEDWVRLLLATSAKLSVPERVQRISAFSASPFTLEAATKRYLRLWLGLG